MPMLPFSLHSKSPIAMLPGTVDPKESISPWRQTSVPASLIPLGTAELYFFETPAGTSRSTPVPEPINSQDISTNALSIRLQKLSDVVSDPPVTITDPLINRTVASTSLDTFKGTSAPPVTVTTSSTMASGTAVAITVTSKTSGPPVTVATGGTPRSGAKTSTSTPNPTTTSTSQGVSGMWLFSLLSALVVVLALIMGLLLWHQRQKRKTLSRGGIRNRVMDTCVEPALVPDEEATTASALGEDRCSGALESDSSGQRPNLSTFFSKWKSSQGSLEEQKVGTDPNLKGEKEPLVGGEDKAEKTPTSDKPPDKDGAAPQSQ